MKILYIHGLGSSGNSRTARILQEHYKDSDVYNPDIPFEPERALRFIQALTQRVRPDIVVASSLGAFYAMQLSSQKKILINPAIYADIDLEKSIGKGTYKYFSKRHDFIDTYTIDDKYLSSLKEMREWFFNECMIDDDFSYKMYGLFGTRDELFSHIKDFKEEFPYAKLETHEFGHRLEESDIKDYLIPLIDRVLKDRG